MSTSKSSFGMPQKRISWELITETARRHPARVAIGVEARVEDTIHLAESAGAQGFADVLVVSRVERKTHLEQLVCDHPCRRLVEMLKAGEVDAVVRGSLSSSPCISALKEGFGVPGLQRAALLQTPSGEHTFLLAPVGVDEGTTADELVQVAARAADLLSLLGIHPRVGVLSGGRDEDRGRHPAVDASFDTASRVCAALEEKGVPCDYSQILIEEAVRTCNVIVAPSGVAGNLIFRSLCLLGGGIGFGAPVLNIPGVYVDTSRESPSYERAIAFASTLCTARTGR